MIVLITNIYIDIKSIYNSYDILLAQVLRFVALKLSYEPS
jgi:hypothetical protein